jgi:hypothetical protein
MFILDQEKDEIINKLESDLKTLEAKNLELKYTNRNLIVTLSEQKSMLKELKSKISELESSKEADNDFEKLNQQHSKLIEKCKNLQIKHNKSLDEITHLKELIPESKSDKGLFGRFLKRKGSDEKENINVNNDDTDKQKN